MKRQLLAITLTAACALTLTGCQSATVPSAPETPKPERNHLAVYQQDLPNGNTVTCVSFDTMAATGDLQCDWNHQVKTGTK